MGVRILHAADLHLGRAFGHPGFPSAERQKDLLATFSRICGLAMEHEVAALLIAGDLFDTYDPRGLTGVVQGEIDRLSRAGARVFIIPGNHDDVWYPGSVWRTSSFPGAHVFTEATFTAVPFEAEGISFRVHGVAFNNTICVDPLPTLKCADSGVHLAMMHATVDPPAGFPVEQRYFPTTMEGLARTGAHYMALGHIHRQRTFEHAGRLLGCYPGSPEGLDATETGPRFAALLEFSGSTPSLKLLPVNTREVREERLDVTGYGEEEIAQRIRQFEDKSTLLTARLTGAPTQVPNTDDLRKRLEEDFFWLEVKDTTDVVRALWVEDIAAENTIRGLFVRRMREQIQAASDAHHRETLELALKLGLVALQRRSAA